MRGAWHKYFVSGLMPPHTPHQHSFFFLAIQKERMLDKKEKQRTVAFFYRKMPVIETSPRPSPSWGGSKFYLPLRACDEVTIARKRVQAMPATAI